MGGVAHERVFVGVECFSRWEEAQAYDELLREESVRVALHAPPYPALVSPSSLTAVAPVQIISRSATLPRHIHTPDEVFPAALK